MDYGTAKILSLISLIFIGIQFASWILLGLVFLVQFALLGALMADGGGSGLICLLLLFLIPLVLMIIPAVAFKLAWDLNRKIKYEALEDRDRTKMIILIVLAFFGGGGLVVAVMNIIMIASWDEIVNSVRKIPLEQAYKPQY